MSSPEDNAKTVNRYLDFVSKGQVDDITELYADDATIEDPVGGEVHIGREAIRGFYTNILNVNATPDVLTLRALGHEAAFHWVLTVDFGEGKGMRVDIISVMKFNEDGKIASMKAYWSQDNVTTF